MKAWIFREFGGPEKLVGADVPEPVAREGEAVVEVKAAGVNPVDRSTIGGRFDWIKPPFVTGAEFAGVLTGPAAGLEAGAHVLVNPKLFCGSCYYCLRGQESACLSNSRMSRAPHIIGVSREGGWQERVSVPEENILPIPSGLSFRDASTIAVDGATAWHLVMRARPALNEFALVVGANGGVGSFAVQIARLYGCEVAAVVGGSAHERLMKDAGADHVIDRNAVDVAGEVRRLTGGRGADIVIDPVGSATFEMSSASLAPLGRYATCGTLTGTEAKLSLLHLYSMQVEYIGSTTFSRSDTLGAMKAMAEGKIRPLIDSVHPFSELPAAMKRLGEHGRAGKVVLDYA